MIESSDVAGILPRTRIPDATEAWMPQYTEDELRELAAQHGYELTRPGEDDAIADAIVESAELANDTAVELAQIEAARDVAVAHEYAQAEVAAAEARADVAEAEAVEAEAQADAIEAAAELASTEAQEDVAEAVELDAAAEVADASDGELLEPDESPAESHWFYGRR